jgi:hypothetical protein
MPVFIIKVISKKRVEAGMLMFYLYFPLIPPKETGHLRVHLHRLPMYGDVSGGAR